MAFLVKQNRKSHECTSHSSRSLGKMFPILDEFSCLIPGLCGLKENSSKTNAKQDDLTHAIGLTQPNENNIFFLVPQNKTFKNRLSASALIQHGKQPDVTQNTAMELLDRFMLYVVYCSCIYMFTCSTNDLAAGNACFRGRTNQIWKTKGNGNKIELFVHLNMNAAFANAPAAIKQKCDFEVSICCRILYLNFCVA